MKKVLIVSLAFPPIPNVGVFRITKFCKYLPETGWKPSVLTQKAKNFYEGIDWTPMEDVSRDIQILRTSNFQPFYWWDHRSLKKRNSKKSTQENPQKSTPENISSAKNHINIKSCINDGVQFIRKLLTVPDERMAWIPQALIPAIKYMHKEKIDVILSSSPSPTNHILGHILSKIFRCPHIVEFRDLWTLRPGYPLRNLPEFLVIYDKFIEKLILKHSKRIIVVNNTLKNQLVDAYPEICDNKVEVIYNGFDEDDIKKIKLSENANKFFTIVYAGSLYGFRNPDFFFNCLSKWINANNKLRSVIRVNFYGSSITAYSERLGKLGINSVVSFLPRVSKNEILQILFSADLSLLIHGFNRLAESSTSTKLFEYLATGKPILAFMPESEASEILRKYSNSCVVSSPDVDSVIRFLDDTYKSWINKNEPDTFLNKLPPEFSRKYQACQLAAILDSIIGRNDSN